MANPIKVAILGGGMGSLAAAWRLSEENHTEVKYDITIYQKDWLLGGKGASTRNSGSDMGLRIEEHGIHLLLGFYSRALHLLRNAYAELAGDPNVPAFDDVIKGWDHVWMADEHPAGVWSGFWRADFPVDAGAVPGATGIVPGYGELLLKAVKRLQDCLDELFAATSSSPAPSLDQTVAQLLAVLQGAPPVLVDALSDFAAGVIDLLVQGAWALAKNLLGVTSVRRAWIGVYVVGTGISGVLRDRILTANDPSIDEMDFRDWLKKHQAVSVPPYISWDSPPVRSIYDLTFSRVTGLAARETVLAMTRMAFGYEGHFTYKMQGGMGEVVFSPLFHALRNRKGVKFLFHHEVVEIKAAQAGADLVVDEITVRLPFGAEGYSDATFAGAGHDGVNMHLWPSEAPSFSSAPHSDKPLKRGTDFDVVILGISVGALAATDSPVSDLRSKNAAFDEMISNSTHVATQSAQLWMRRTAQQLGWPESKLAMLISYQRPFNSWVDMSHLHGKEALPADVKSVHYICDELRPGEGTIETDVRNNAIDWIEAWSPFPWPGFTWDDLHDPKNGTGQARMDAQYYRANFLGSERYVTVGPGSLKHRLSAAGSGFTNLALAGDWVKSELSAGCLESATASGLDAGEAVVAGQVKP